MAENKTKQTKASVDKFINSIKDESIREDCNTIIKLMKSVTKEEPKMWGPSIIGFGTYHYKYASGREGDMCITGFSSRKHNLTIYLMIGFKKQKAQLEKLGKYKTSKSCLYIKSLKDVDVKVLKEMINSSVKEMKKLYPPQKGI
ncbi:MAG: DUF1801 domain-containing protein [Ignavibacterium sp.]|nr:DUF1801 domain-containing protein [Ignavibacterium sp.]